MAASASPIRAVRNGFSHLPASTKFRIDESNKSMDAVIAVFQRNITHITEQAVTILRQAEELIQSHKETKVALKNLTKETKKRKRVELQLETERGSHAAAIRNLQTVHRVALKALSQESRDGAAQLAERSQRETQIAKEALQATKRELAASKLTILNLEQRLSHDSGNEELQKELQKAKKQLQRLESAKDFAQNRLRVEVIKANRAQEGLEESEQMCARLIQRKAIEAHRRLVRMKGEDRRLEIQMDGGKNPRPLKRRRG